MRKTVLAPEVVAAMRVAYEAGQGYRAVAALGGISPTTFRRQVGRWGWTREVAPLRRRRPPGRPATPGASPAAFTPPAAGAPLRMRLERLLAHRIEALENEAVSGRALDPDANARAIAANARTLALLRRMPPEPKEETAPDDEPPRSLAELRDELRRHLERIGAEEEEPGSFSAGPDAGGDRPTSRALADHLPAGSAPA